MRKDITNQKYNKEEEEEEEEAPFILY